MQSPCKGYALTAGKDPARETYLADLNAVAAEVSRLHAARGREAGLQLARCGGLWKADWQKAFDNMSIEDQILTNSGDIKEQLKILGPYLTPTQARLSLGTVEAFNKKSLGILDNTSIFQWTSLSTPGGFNILEKLYNLKYYTESDEYILIPLNSSYKTFSLTQKQLRMVFHSTNWEALKSFKKPAP